ncbi:hypothetical protein NUU61_000286 [Penicillium alfredii]|uniref:RING-type E3 ubiquitin transferase n=1 Tax=Penicillium alfredii TaxID=1506179 RepID=A0A9W9KQS0_9EURO|nr:uncharacterized protein NUU61_000286 [Penicillium alfredii]KAJ5114527.1 hypothetical protein NUU61_000286 [Penicillium alfredii]
MRLAAYTGASVALATGVFLKALHQRANFYSACVYLSQSSANLMILTNLCLLATGFLLFWLQRLLYGPLRPIETEQLYERAWFAVTETCLAMTIFRGELGGWFLVMFISLLVGKVWGWIGEGRVEYLEQQPPPIRYCITTVIHQARPDMMVMFGFEFAILSILSTSTAARYAIALVEIYISRQQLNAKMEERRNEIRAARLEAIREHARSGASAPPTDLPDENDVNELEFDVPGWEEKGRWVFYLDLLTDFLKLTVYLTFFAILLTFYGLPIHILRDVVVTIRSFARRIMDFLRYRNATRDMNERYPNATAEEVAREDVCIICREEMIPAQPAPEAGEAGAQPAPNAPRVPDRLRPKKLPCGHILHFACLRSWLERQQNCPTCRRPVLVPSRTQVAAGTDANRPDNGGGAQNFPGGNLPPGQPGAQADGAPRARVYQFGPFRIGFGAVRGDLLQNLHQQIHQGNGPLQPAVNANPAGPRQIGFGFGFGRRPAAPSTPTTPAGTSSAADIQTQLQQIEQRITQEINSLRAAAQHLHHVRSLQLELERARLEQAGSLAQAASFSNSTPGAPVTSSFTTHRQFVSSPETATLGSGDPRLPEGLSIPPGWNLIPLHSAEQGVGVTQAASPVPTSENPPTAPAPNLGVASQPAAASGATASPENRSETAQASFGATTGEATAAPVADNLPQWGSAATEASTDRSLSPSQEWTDVPFEQASEAGPASGEGSTKVVADHSEPTESSSKGKGRAATVEEAVDDEAS